MSSESGRHGVPSAEESGNVDNSTFFASDFAQTDDAIMERILALEPDPTYCPHRGEYSPKAGGPARDLEE
jgi:hypothetical protein